MTLKLDTDLHLIRQLDSIIIAHKNLYNRHSSAYPIIISIENVERLLEVFKQMKIKEMGE